MNALLRRALLLGTLFAGAAPAAELPAAADLRAEAAAAARSGQPLVILYSRRDCHFCERIRQDHLHALADSPGHRGIVVRQIDQDSTRPLRDFGGRPATHAGIAAGERIKLVPVVAFYGPDGRRLAPPIIGARIAD
jgi:hypothetical protein